MLAHVLLIFLIPGAKKKKNYKNNPALSRAGLMGFQRQENILKKLIKQVQENACTEEVTKKWKDQETLFCKTSPANTKAPTTYGKS